MSKIIYNVFSKKAIAFPHLLCYNSYNEKQEVTTMTREKAWRIAHKMIKDLQLDERASAFAGYPIYRSELEYYDYVCDLGSRLEVNFSDDPKSINLWIEAD